MVSKRSSTQLSNARAQRQYQSAKKLRTDTEKSNPTTLDHNEPSSDDDEPEMPRSYWNNSSADETSDSDKGENDIPGYHSESDSEPELPLRADLPTPPTTLKSEDTADAKLRGPKQPRRGKEGQLRKFVHFRCRNLSIIILRPCLSEPKSTDNLPIKPFGEELSICLEVEDVKPRPTACLLPVSQE